MMTGTSFMNYAFDFGTITANSSGTGNFAYLYGSSGDDDFTAAPNAASMTRSAASTSVANGFETIFGYAGAGGDDTATLNDSGNVDTFFGYATHALMTGTSFTNYAFDFPEIGASASGSGDVAYLYGSTGDDTFGVDTTGATMNRSTASANSTVGFEKVYGFAVAGGVDTASMGGSTGADLFFGFQAYSIMRDSSSSFYYYAGGFSEVQAVGGIGDIAYLYDSDGDDYFTFSQRDAVASLVPTDPLVDPVELRVSEFDKILAYATNGGYDTAEVQGTTGADTFYGRNDYGILRDTAGTDYYNLIKYFDLVYADPGDFDPGNDTADVPDPVTLLLYDLDLLPEW